MRIFDSYRISFTEKQSILNNPLRKDNFYNLNVDNTDTFVRFGKTQNSDSNEPSKKKRPSRKKKPLTPEEIAIRKKKRSDYEKKRYASKPADEKEAYRARYRNRYRDASTEEKLVISLRNQANYAGLSDAERQKKIDYAKLRYVKDRLKKGKIPQVVHENLSILYAAIERIKLGNVRKIK